MKDRFGAVSKVIVIILIALIICSCVMALFDSAFNGAVGDWFVANFIRYSEWENEGEHFYRETFKWSALKLFITYSAIALVVVWTGSIILTFVLSRKQYAKKVSEDTAKFVLSRMVQPEEMEYIPKEYVHIRPHLTEMQKQISDSKLLVLEEVNKKNDLIAYLAHDLKTPLTSVVGYLSLLEEAPDMPPAQKAKYTRIALDKALRLESLINEFFDITRYNLHEIVLNKESIDLSYMLRQIADEFYPLLQSKKNTISLQTDDDLMVLADPLKLARVFNNILKNAIAYSYTDSPIRITAEKQDSNICITFENTGKTIPPDKLQAIFERFYRLDDARSSNTGGAGLGLAIAKEIVTRHDGQILVESQNETTAFRVFLPL